jgi:phage-related minor tail protein
MTKQLNKFLAFCEEEWTTKDGSKIKYKDLEVDHINNIINYLQKRLDNMEDTLDFPSFRGEAAQHYGEIAFNQEVDQIRALKQQIRGLKLVLSMKMF